MLERIKNLVREAFLFLLFICYLRYKSKKLFCRKQINDQIEKYAQSIISDCRNRKISEVTFVVILRGAKPFSKELLKRINSISNLKFEVVYARCSSYGMGTHGTKVDVEIFNPQLLTNKKRIIILEDIIESGETLNALVEKLLGYDISILRVLTLVDKSKGKHTIRANIRFDRGLEYSGPLFLYGFGPDLYRGLRWLGEIWGIKEELFEKINDEIIQSIPIKACLF